LRTTGFESKRILITVKAYPIASISYGETVCCAGIDIDSQQWIRLYPIPFRDLESDQRFRKYSLIEAKCAKAADDLRPESYRIQAASIKIFDHFSTDNGWHKRKEIVFRAPKTSFCRLKSDQIEKRTSLGLVKPEKVTFESEKRTPSDPNKKMRAYSHPGLFEKPKRMIEEIPYQFYYHFFCVSEANCPGHRLSIIDWEIFQAYRKWRDRYSDAGQLIKSIEKKWSDIIDPNKKDVFFFVGNLHRFQDIFSVLGVFWPPLKS
jgi:hypothetical protein